MAPPRRRDTLTRMDLPPPPAGCPPSPRPPRQDSSAMRPALLISTLLCAASAHARVDADDLKRGLVATHQDEAKAELVRLEPTVALNLKAGESAHPRLSAGGGSVTWQGYLNVTRADTYR